MQRKPQTEELPLECFEDPIDMLDHVYEKIDHAVYLWVVWSKAFGCSDEQDALKAVLEEIVSQESESLYKRLKVDLRANKDGIPQINASIPRDS